jgi:hypothetical protein
MSKEKKKFHLFRVFNREYYESIDVFQGKKVINAPMHVRDVNVEGDAVYIPLAQETQDENENFNSQENVQEAPNLIPNSQGAQIPGLMNLSENSKHLLNFNHAPTVFINIPYSNPSTPIPRNTIVKRNHNNMFSLVIDSTNKNSKTILDTMGKNNDTQCEIK